jgi:hypothetical protein
MWSPRVALACWCRQLLEQRLHHGRGQRPHSCLPHGLDVVPQPLGVPPEPLVGSQSLHDCQGGLPPAGATAAGAAVQAPLEGTADVGGMEVLDSAGLPEGFLRFQLHVLADLRGSLRVSVGRQLSCGGRLSDCMDRVPGSLQSLREHCLPDDALRQVLHVQGGHFVCKRSACRCVRCHMACMRAHTALHKLHDFRHRLKGQPGPPPKQINDNIETGGRSR